MCRSLHCTLLCETNRGACLLRKALAMIVLGLLLGLTGTDLSSGAPRFAFDMLFFTRPLSAMFLLIAVVALVAICLPALSKKRDEVFSEVD